MVIFSRQVLASRCFISSHGVLLRKDNPSLSPFNWPITHTPTTFKPVLIA